MSNVILDEIPLIILTKETFEILQKVGRDFSDALALYTFYTYTAKWQKTNNIKATTAYTANGMNWTEERVRKIKKILIDKGLISDFVRYGEDNKIMGHYIIVKYVMKNSISQDNEPHSANSVSVGNTETNALLLNNIQ